MIDGRAHVVPEDVQAVLPSVASHRLNALEGDTNEHVRALLEGVAIP
jgi:MoxR-like ATPase